MYRPPTTHTTYENASTHHQVSSELYTRYYFELRDLYEGAHKGSDFPLEMTTAHVGLGFWGFGVLGFGVWGLGWGEVHVHVRVRVRVRVRARCLFV